MTLQSYIFWNHITAIFLCLVLGSCNTTCSGTMSGNVTVNPRESSPHASTALSPLVACVEGERALAHVKKLVSFAPRHAGTPGIKKTREYIVGTLAQLGVPAIRHPFTAYTPHPELKTVEMENISVSFSGKTVKRVFLSGHFDGKIIEKGTFYGANDGGSSTGLLLEMARCLKAYPPEEKVELVFFDGEEALVQWSDSDSLYGSKKYVSELIEKGETDGIAALVNIDMVGDERLAYVHDSNSTPGVFELLVSSAKKLGYGDLFSGPRGSIGDDHMPFIQMKIPAAVLIDLNYGPGWESNAYWHTENDNMSHISAASMEATGQIVLSALPQLAQYR